MYDEFEIRFFGCVVVKRFSLGKSSIYSTKEGFRHRSLKNDNYWLARNHRLFSIRCQQKHELKAARWTEVGGSWLEWHQRS